MHNVLWWLGLVNVEHKQIKAIRAHKLCTQYLHLRNLPNWGYFHAWLETSFVIE